LAVFYNPLTTPIERRIRLPLYYSGLTHEALVRYENGATQTLHLERDYSAEVNVTIPASGHTWLRFKAAR
jgi:hypothetical protein